jgi:hypothetical protein
MAGRQITIRAGSAAIVRGPRPNVAFWHFAAFAALQNLGRYQGNNGQPSARKLNGYAAFDPLAQRSNLPQCA